MSSRFNDLTLQRFNDSTIQHRKSLIIRFALEVIAFLTISALTERIGENIVASLTY